jgi:excisionase family DNA binding protein
MDGTMVNENTTNYELRYYVLEQVAAILHLSVKTVREWVRMGTLPATYCGGQYLVHHRDLVGFLASRPSLASRQQPGKEVRA